MSARETTDPADEPHETARHTGWANLALTVLTIVAMFFVFEVGLRLYAGIRVLSFSNFIRHRVDALSVHPFVSYDPQLGWVTRSDTHTPHFNSGAYGIRLTNGVERAVPQGGILAVGDSFTFGDEADDNESWPAYIEAMSGTPVANAATGAWGTDQIVLRAEAMIDIAHPKTVIIGFFADDMSRSEFHVLFGSQKPFFTVSNGELVLHNVPVPRSEVAAHGLGWPRAVLGYSYAAVWAAERLGYAQWLYQGHAADERATPAGTGQQISCLLLKRLKQRSDSTGIRLMLVMQYGYGQLSPSPPGEAVAVVKCASGLGITVVDTWAPLAALAVNDPGHLRTLYVYHQEWRGMGHMSAACKRFVAGLIAKLLETRN